MIFLFPPLRETVEAMAYSLSLGLLYLGLLCGNGLVSARSELFTPGTALTTTSETFHVATAVQFANKLVNHDTGKKKMYICIIFQYE